MTKRDIYKESMQMCSEAISSILEDCVREDLDTGDITWNDDYDLHHITQDVFSAIGGDVGMLIENILEQQEGGW